MGLGDNRPARRLGSNGTDSISARTAQPELLKNMNRELVLGLARQARVVSRAELARRSGLSKVTAAAIVDDLVKAGLLRYIGSGPSQGGRPPLLLEYVPSSHLAVGIEFAHDEVIAVLTDLDAHVLREASRAVSGRDPREVLSTAESLACELIANTAPSRVLGVGFASPGLVDVESGVVRVAIDTGWRDVHAAEVLGRGTGLPAFVANRSKAAALAERWRGAEAGAYHLIYVFVGSGIAAGIVHGDTPYLGATSSAGELGHITVDPDGPLCECGNRGCLHVLAGEEAIARRARELARGSQFGALIESVGGDVRLITADAVIDSALSGDPLAKQAIDEAATYVGIALANVVNLLNPDVIILGGPTSRAGLPFLDTVRAEVQRRALSTPAGHVRIALSSLGKAAGAIGGATLVLRQTSSLIFESEAIQSEGCPYAETSSLVASRNGAEG